jgi:hypothetical protein
MILPCRKYVNNLRENPVIPSQEPTRTEANPNVLDITRLENDCTATYH